jgi:hypothetical protein
MKINLANWDRSVRFIAGVLLFTWAVAGGPIWAYLGLVLIATAAFRFCPLYRLLGISTYHPTVSAKDSNPASPSAGPRHP